MPAYRPTAGCIWTSFLASGKRHLILTGSRGIGKTTLLAGLTELMDGGRSLPGLTSWAVRGRGVFLRENSTGHTAQVGVFDPTLPAGEKPMRPIPEAFRGFGTAVLEQCAQAAGEFVAIDEVGFLETACPEYCDAVRRLLDKKRVIAVVRKQGLRFLQELCCRPDAFTIDLDAPFGRSGCVIMASGMGRRFGGNKLMADFGGRPMIRQVLDATAGIFANRVVVTRHADVAGLCRQLGIEYVLHSLPLRSDTIRLGLQALAAGGGAPELSGCAFCPADQPLLRRETVAALVISAARQPDAIWRTEWQGVQGAPIWFPAWAFHELSALPPGKGGSAVAARYPASVHTIPAASSWELADADTPEQLNVLFRAENVNNL